MSKAQSAWGMEHSAERREQGAGRMTDSEKNVNLRSENMQQMN